jgi:hypothetical protein
MQLESVEKIYEVPVGSDLFFLSFLCFSHGINDAFYSPEITWNDFLEIAESHYQETNILSFTSLHHLTDILEKIFCHFVITIEEDICCDNYWLNQSIEEVEWTQSRREYEFLIHEIHEATGFDPFLRTIVGQFLVSKICERKRFRTQINSRHLTGVLIYYLTQVPMKTIFVRTVLRTIMMSFLRVFGVMGFFWALYAWNYSIQVCESPWSLSDLKGEKDFGFASRKDLLAESDYTFGSDSQ